MKYIEDAEENESLCFNHLCQELLTECGTIFLRRGCIGRVECWQNWHWETLVAIAVKCFKIHNGEKMKNWQWDTFEGISLVPRCCYKVF